MITCPWCGTNYAAFQSNCSNCGGPLPSATEPIPPVQATSHLEGPGPTPPSPPRSISDRYAWRLLWSDGGAVAAFVFLILGAVFSLVGAGLTLAIFTAFVGLPFLALGIVFLGTGILLGAGRYKKARGVVDVLRDGEAARGQITGVDENLSVRINSRHPWTITYRFQFSGQEYEGRVKTLNAPGPVLRVGQPAWVLYLPGAPDKNSLYPHP